VLWGVVGAFARDRASTAAPRCTRGPPRLHALHEGEDCSLGVDCLPVQGVAVELAAIHPASDLPLARQSLNEADDEDSPCQFGGASSGGATFVTVMQTYLKGMPRSRLRWVDGPVACLARP
jgi:hypothetical protein